MSKGTTAPTRGQTPLALGQRIFPIRSKLALYSFLIGTSTVVMVALLTYFQASQILRQERLETFRSLRNTLTQSLVAFFSEKRNEIAGQSESETVRSAVKEFTDARANLLGDLAANGFTVDDSFMSAVRAQNERVYQEVLLRPLIASGRKDAPGAETFLPSDRESQILLYVYNTSNPAPAGQKHDNNLPSAVSNNSALPAPFRTAFGATTYAQVMGKYHPYLSHLCQRFGYTDLLLADPAGNIVYSYAKQFDFASSGVSDYWQQTDLGRLFLGCWYGPLPNAASLSNDQVLNTDFHRYFPDSDNPRLFFGSPLVNQASEKIGVLVYEISTAPLTRITTFDNRLEKAGLGKTGEAYISGSDFVPRTESRFLPTLTEGVQKAVAFGPDGQPDGFSAVLQLPVQTQINKTIFSDSDPLNTSEMVYSDYRGVSTLGLGAPLPLPGLNWGLVLKIDSREAYEPAFRLGISIALIGGIALIIVVVASFIGATNFARPITELAKSAEEIAAGAITQRAAVTTRDEIGLLALRFNSMVDQLNSRSEQQMRKILDTVNEGLFLVSPQLTIQVPYSAALEGILGRRDLEGKNLLEVLAKMVTENLLHTVREYIDILLDPKVKEKLIRQLNPLSEVPVDFEMGPGKFKTKFLQITFSRVMENQQISQIMVAINDVTERVELAQELEKAQAKTATQFDLIFGIMHVEPGALRDFIEAAEEDLQTINDNLRMESDATESEKARQNRYRTLLNDIYRCMHNFKGNAAVLRVTFFEELAHGFEGKVAELQTQRTLSGNDFLGLTLQLSTILRYLDETKELIKKFGEMNRSLSENPSSTKQALFRSIEQLGQDLALKLQKQVRFKFDDSYPEEIPSSHRRILRNSLIQLTRNSLAHGLETPAQRSAEGKDPTGTLSIQLMANQEVPGLTVLFNDDGRGLSVPIIRQKALAAGIFTRAQADAMTDEEWAQTIFLPGFSTADEVTLTAGRGVGLDLVKAQLASIGGEIRVQFEPGRYCSFQLTFPA